jgi:hypothetical protein
MGSLDYFEKVKLKGNKAENLQQKYQEATKGLDKDVAFEALEGGRVFDTSDRKRYDALMANRGKAKEKAQVQKANTSSNVTENVTEDVVKDLPKIGIPMATANSMQEQNIQQDNDITTNIDGNNNTVNNNQDNSISQFGGNTESYLGGWMDKYRFNKRVA